MTPGGRIGSLIEDGEAFTEDQLDFIGCKQRQVELSRQMTRLVDVVYALVLVQGAVYYRSLFTMEGEFLHPSKALPVVLALILIYFTAIQSFMDYHLASEDQPYQMLDKARRKNDLRRFYLDIVIVGLYSFLLLKCHVLLTAPAEDIWPVFAALVAVFLFYGCWGKLRQATLPPGGQKYGGWLIFACLSLYVGLLIIYTLVPQGWIANAACLFGALVVMGFYRWHNWAQNRFCESQPVDPKPTDAELKPLLAKLSGRIDRLVKKIDGLT